MKPIIEFSNEDHDYLGEFIEPNIIKIYLNTHINKKVNPFHTIIHEYTHYCINNNKFLLWVFNKLNTYIMHKYNVTYYTHPKVYTIIPEKRFCNFVANKLSIKYLIHKDFKNTKELNRYLIKNQK